MYATLASRDVDCCLIPESPFYLDGAGGLFEFVERRLKENGHMVIVIAEGAGQDLFSESIHSVNKDASGNKLLQDVGLWISQKIKVDHHKYIYILYCLLGPRAQDFTRLELLCKAYSCWMPVFSRIILQKRTR